MKAFHTVLKKGRGEKCVDIGMILERDIEMYGGGRWPGHGGYLFSRKGMGTTLESYK
jgi:hypothetical protein